MINVKDQICLQLWQCQLRQLLQCYSGAGLLPNHRIIKGNPTLRDIYDLINYIATTLPVDWNKFDKLLTLMLKEEEKLKNWKDGVKLKQRKK